MAHAFPGALRRSLIATAAVLLLGTVGATCGVVVRGPADAQPATEASAEEGCMPGQRFAHTRVGLLTQPIASQARHRQQHSF